MNKQKNALMELLKNIVVLILLFLVTLLLLKLPKFYYEKKDKALFQEVSTIDYSVSTSVKKMSPTQESEALISDDTLITTDEDFFYSEDQESYTCQKLIAELEQLLIDPWFSYFQEFLNYDSEFTHIAVVKMKLYRVIDNTIYSYTLGALRFEYDDSYISANGLILFDTDNTKILALEGSCAYLEEADLYLKGEEYFFDAYYIEEAEQKFKEYYKDCADFDNYTLQAYDPYYLVIAPISPESELNEALVFELEQLFIKSKDTKVDFQEALGVPAETE